MNNIKTFGLQCPICRVDLVISDKRGFEIGDCPTCRGIWIDRGELEKIMDRCAIALSGLQPSADRCRGADDRNDPRHRNYRKRGRGRRSWLNEIFD